MEVYCGLFLWAFCVTVISSKSNFSFTWNDHELARWQKALIVFFAFPIVGAIFWFIGLTGQIMISPIAAIF